MNPDNLLKIVVITIMLLIGLWYCIHNLPDAIPLFFGIYLALLARALANHFGLGL